MVLPVTAGLVGRYDAQALTGLADGAEVTAWADVSGAGNNLAGTGAVYKTNVLNGHPSVRFDGVNDQLSDTLTTAISGDRTVFTVVKNPTNTGAVHAWVSSDNGGSGLVMMKWSTADRWILGGNSGGNQYVEFYDATLLGANSVWSMTITTGKVVTVRAGGVQKVTGTASAMGASIIDFAVGTHLARTGRFYAGDVYEVLLYDRVLTAQEVLDVEAYLDGKWMQAGGTVHTLTPDGTAHSHVAGTPAVTAAGELAPDGTAHVHAAGTPTLTQHHLLTPDGAVHTHAAGSPGELVATVVAENWSGYPNSSWGDPQALDGARKWRQGPNLTPDGTKAGWRIQAGQAVAGYGDSSDINAGQPILDPRIDQIARCLDDLGSPDHYVRATIGAYTGLSHYGLLARMNATDSGQGYYAQIRPENGDIRIFTVVAGAFSTFLGTAAYTPTVGDVIELRCFGAAITLLVNGTAVVTVASDTEVTTGQFTGVYASISTGDTARFTNFHAGPLDESGVPVEGPTVAAIPAVMWAWTGGVTDTSARVRARLRNVTSATLTVATDQALSNVVWTSTAQAPDDRDIVAFEPTGLSGGTVYWWAVTSGGETVGEAHRFKTAPASGSFTFTISGDAGTIGTANAYVRTHRTSDSPTYERIVDRDPAFHLFAGDRHYRDYNTTDLTPHLLGVRDIYANPRAAALFRNVWVAQMWDDHDFTGDSADSSATGRDAAVEVFRRAVPAHDYLVDTPLGPVGYTFAWGRARFIVCDHRSAQVRSGSTTMLGAAQLAAVKGLIETATEPVIFLYVGTPWISAANPSSDDWGFVASERADLAETIEAHAKGRVVILHADAHMLAADDGTNSQYAATADPGPPVWCSAPVDSNTSIKGGPYSYGTVPATAGPVEQQYATIGVVDNGATLDVTWTGWSVDGATETAVIGPVTYQVAAGSGATALSPDGAAHDHVAGSPTVVQSHGLTASPAVHDQVAGAPGLSVSVAVEPDGTAHEHVAGTAALAQTHALTPDTSSHVQSAGSPTLAVTGTLSPAPVVHDHVAGSPTLAQTHELAPDGTAHAHDAGSPVLSVTAALIPDGAAHLHTAGAPALTQAHTLGPAPSAHMHTVGSPTVAVAGTLQPDAVAHSHVAGSPGLTQTHTLGLDAVAHEHAAGDPTLAVVYTFTADGTAHLLTSGSPALTLPGAALYFDLEVTALSPVLVRPDAVGPTIARAGPTSPALVVYAIDATVVTLGATVAAVDRPEPSAPVTVRPAEPAVVVRPGADPVFR